MTDKELPTGPLLINNGPARLEMPTGKEDRPMSTAKKLEEIDKLEADLTPPESDKERLRLLKGAAGAWKGKRAKPAKNRDGSSLRRGVDERRCSTYTDTKENTCG